MSVTRGNICLACGGSGITPEWKPKFNPGDDIELHVSGDICLIVASGIFTFDIDGEQIKLSGYIVKKYRSGNVFKITEAQAMRSEFGYVPEPLMTQSEMVDSMWAAS